MKFAIYNFLLFAAAATTTANINSGVTSLNLECKIWTTTALTSFDILISKSFGQHSMTLMLLKYEYHAQLP